MDLENLSNYQYLGIVEFGSDDQEDGNDGPRQANNTDKVTVKQ